MTELQTTGPIKQIQVYNPNNHTNFVNYSYDTSSDPTRKLSKTLPFFFSQLHRSTAIASMAATMRRARTLLLASRCLLPSSTASDHRLLRAAPQRLHPLPAPSDLIASKPVSLGLAGALSFSLTLMTRAEAKEPPAAELVPKDVVLYQYEACPFCNKVKGASFWFPCFRIFYILFVSV